MHNCRIPDQYTKISYILDSGNEQSKVKIFKNTSYNNINKYETLRDRYDKRCERPEHWRLGNVAKKN